MKVSKKDWIIVEDTHEGIVTQEEFDRAQAMLREFVEKDGSSGNKVLDGKIRCGICGHVMHRVDVKEPYYICHTPRATEVFACPTERILERDILSLLLDSLRVQAGVAVEFERIWTERHRQEKKDISPIRKTFLN